LIDEIESIDTSGYVAEKAEQSLLREILSLRREHLMQLSPITLQNIADIKLRMAEDGYFPVHAAADVVVEAHGVLGGKKISKQFEKFKKKNRGVDYWVKLLRTKEKAFWEAQFGVLGSELYTYFINPLANAVMQYKETADNLIGEVYKDLKKAGYLDNLKLRRKRKVSEFKVAMLMHYMREKGLRDVYDKKTKVGKAGFRDIFGMMLGDEKALDGLTKEQKEAAEKELSLYSPEEQEIIRNLHVWFKERFTENGVLSLDKMDNEIRTHLTKMEEALYDLHLKITARTGAMQRVANEAKNMPFDEVDGYIKRILLGVQDTMTADFLSSAMRVNLSAASGKAVEQNDPRAVKLDLVELLLRGIWDTSLEYHMAVANQATTEVINRAELPKEVAAALHQAKKDMLQLEFDKHYYENKLLTNLLNAAAYGMLVSTGRTAAETITAVPATYLALAKQGGLLPSYNRTKTLELMEATGSTLIDKATFSGEKHFEVEGSRNIKPKGVLKKIGHGAVSISESLAMPLWYSVFAKRYKQLTGHEFKGINDSYWQEVKEAAAYADKEVKQVTGGGTKMEARHHIGLPGVFMWKGKVKDLSMDRNTILGKLFSFLTEYTYRDYQRIISSVAQIKRGDDIGTHLGKITASLVNFAVYGLAAMAARYGIQWLIASLNDNDDEKEKAEEAIETLLSKEGLKEYSVGMLLQSMTIPLSGAGRMAMTGIASAIYAMVDDKETKDKIADVMSKEFYSPVIAGSYPRYVKNEMGGYHRTAPLYEVVANIHPAVKYIYDKTKDFTNKDIGIKQMFNIIREKIEAGEPFSYDEAEWLIISANLLGVFNVFLATIKGVEIPESKTFKKFA